MNHPVAFRPEELAKWSGEKMGKSTIFSSDRMMVGLNAFEAGQEHKLHAHEGMDKLYLVLSGSGVLLLEDHEEQMSQGMMTVAPAGVPHGIRNDGEQRLLLLTVLAPSP